MQGPATWLALVLYGGLNFWAVSLKMNLVKKPAPTQPDDEVTPLPQRAQHTILSGNMQRTVWSLTWPSAIALLLQTITNIIDRLFVSELGGLQVAAIGLGQNLYMLLFGAVTAISAATTALVARYTGSNEPISASESARQSLWAGVLVSLVMAAIIYPTAPFIFRLMAGRAAEVVPLAQGYFYIVLAGVVPLFGMTIAVSALRGTGDMLTPVKVTLAGAVLTVIFDWIFIFGNLGVPALGLNGAAWASLASKGLACLYAFWLLANSRLEGAVLPVRLPDFSWIRRILLLGYPAGVQSLLRTAASMVYFSFLGRTAEGEAAMAALTIGLSIEAIAFMPGAAFSAAAAAMVGQNLGARDPDRANHAAWTCARQSMLMTSLLALIFFVFAEQIAAQFSHNPEIQRLTISYLRVNALSQPFIALLMSMTGALQGAGDTRSPTFVTFVAMWLIRLPLTWYLAIGMGIGAEAAWWTMSGSMMVSGVTMAIIFSSGRWKGIKI